MEPESTTRSSVEMRIEQVLAAYKQAHGTVPPAVARRLDLFAGKQREAMVSLEETRALLVDPEKVSQRTVQLIQFALYTANGDRDGALHHGAAVLKQGGTIDDLGVAAHLAFLARGMPALLLGIDVVEAVTAQTEEAIG